MKIFSNSYYSPDNNLWVIREVLGFQASLGK